MKSKQQKRDEAIERAKSYRYENSRAKRQGVDRDTWDKARQSLINKLEGRND